MFIKMSECKCVYAYTYTFIYFYKSNRNNDSCQPSPNLLSPQTLNSIHLLVKPNGIHDGLPDLWPL